MIEEYRAGRGTIEETHLPQQCSEGKNISFECISDAAIVVVELERFAMVIGVGALEVAKHEGIGFEDVAHHQIAMDDPTRVEVCDGLDRVEHPFFDVLDSAIVGVGFDDETNVSFVTRENELSGF
jgi:hypothetical protein